MRVYPPIRRRWPYALVAFQILQAIQGWVQRCLSLWELLQPIGYHSSGENNQLSLAVLLLDPFFASQGDIKDNLSIVYTY